MRFLGDRKTKAMYKLYHFRRIHPEEHDVYLALCRPTQPRRSRGRNGAHALPSPIREADADASPEEMEEDSEVVDLNSVTQRMPEDYETIEVPFPGHQTEVEVEKRKEDTANTDTAQVDLPLQARSVSNTEERETWNRRIVFPPVSQTWGTRNKTQIHCDAMWTYHLACAGIDLTVAKSSATTMMLKNFLPRYNPRTGDYYLTKTLPVVHDNIMNVIKSICTKATNLSEQVQLSISKLEGTRGNFLVVSLHLVDDHFVYHNVVLGVRHIKNEESGSEMLEAIKNVLSGFDGLSNHPKKILFDATDEHLELAVSGLEAVEETKDCVIRRLDRAIRSGLHFSEVGHQLHQTLYSFGLLLVNDRIMQKEFRKLCYEMQGKFKCLKLGS